MGNETAFGAKKYIDAIEYVLGVYNRNLENIVCLIGDNVAVNKSCANIIGVLLIGCASHKLNLAVTGFLNEHGSLFCKVNRLMGKDLKTRGALRQKTPLSPLQMNVTRWLSTFKMFERYAELKEHLSVFQEDPQFF